MTITDSRKYRAELYEDQCTVCGPEDTVPPTVTLIRWYSQPGARYPDRPVVTLCRACLREMLDVLA